MNTKLIIVLVFVWWIKNTHTSFEEIPNEAKMSVPFWLRWYPCFGKVHKLSNILSFISFPNVALKTVQCDNVHSTRLQRFKPSGTLKMQKSEAQENINQWLQWSYWEEGEVTPSTHLYVFLQTSAEQFGLPYRRCAANPTFLGFGRWGWRSENTQVNTSPLTTVCNLKGTGQHMCSQLVFNTGKHLSLYIQMLVRLWKWVKDITLGIYC